MSWAAYSKSWGTLLGPPARNAWDVYESVAPRYERFRALWLRLAGKLAEQAMLDDLRAPLQPGQRILDAGCGTEALSRQIQALQPEVRLTLLDISQGMLTLSLDIHGDHMLGDSLYLSFADDSFDIVVSGWVIETVPEPMLAVSEYLRVLSPAGHLLYTFCSLPGGWLSRAGPAFLRAAVERGFAGDFLPPEKTPWHDCARTHRVSFQGGLTTEIALQKCCTVGSIITPKR